MIVLSFYKYHGETGPAGSRLADEELRQKGHQDILSTGKMESDLRMIMDNVTLPHQALS